MSHGPHQANLVLIANASSEGSGEPAHPRSRARTFAARSYKQWIKRNLQTESQIPGPAEWLGMRNWNFWLCWGLTSLSTIFQSCRDGAIASWVINQYFRGVKCLAQGHNTAEVGLEPRTSRSGVRHSTTEPPRSPEIEICHDGMFEDTNSLDGAHIWIFWLCRYHRKHYTCTHKASHGQTKSLTCSLFNIHNKYSIGRFLTPPHDKD